MTELPRGWTSAQLSEICTINPRVNKIALDPASVVSFVPMSAVEAETGNIDISETRNFKAVRKGYRPFQKGDILFAKITPCMENGKMAIVPDLASTYGFGSTEFHVLRPRDGIDPRFIYHAVSNRAFRFHAEHNMTGAVGQKRVPAAVLEEYEVDLPPTNEQRRIVERIDALFDEVSRGVKSLRTTKNTTALYRQSLLKSAFEGRLTAEWRAQNPDKLESPSSLLTRIREEREARYKVALNNWKRVLAKWREEDNKGKKPVKPKQMPDLVELSVPYSAHSSWVTLTLGSLGRVETGTTPSTKERDNFGGDIPFFKPTDLEAGVDVHESREFLSKMGAMASRSFSAGAILVTCIGATIGKTGLATVNATCNQQINFIEPDPSIEPKFIYYQIVSPLFQDKIKSSASSTTLPILNKRKFSQLPTIICSPAEQVEIVRILDARLEAVEVLDSEIDANLARADALRQSILKKAFAGELVPQDPNDEPASTLVAPARAARTEAPARRRTKRVVTEA